MARFDREIPASVFEDLLDVGIALSSQGDLNQLLTLILSEARRLTTADAATLYLAAGNSLQAEVAQCQTFINRWGEKKAADIFKSFTLPISTESIAGAAAFKKQTVNIPDMQDADAEEIFHYSDDFDRAHDYSTHSNLAVPMLDRDNAVIGVLQLINAQEEGSICPFDDFRVKLAQALASQAAVAIRNASLTRKLRGAHLDTLRRLGVAAEWRDKETANHISRVSHYARILAETMGESEEEMDLITHASPMHDVGKVGVPDAILHKPGRLEPEERKIMETHSIIGANILAHSDDSVMQLSRIITLGHHEKWNGKGYPQGLKGKGIPKACRTVALADVYDALSSRRCYKPAFSHEKVMGIMKEEKGEHFDPAVSEAFMDSLDRIIDIRNRFADREEDFAKLKDYANITIE